MKIAASNISTFFNPASSAPISLREIDARVLQVFDLVKTELLQHGEANLKVQIDPSLTDPNIAGGYDSDNNLILINPTSFQKNVQHALKGLASTLQTPEAEIFKDKWFKAAMANHLVSTLAHEVAHSLLHKIEQNVSAQEFDLIIDKVLSLDIQFRRRVIGSMVLTKYPLTDDYERTDLIQYLAGDSHAIADAYHKVEPRLIAGEFLAELGSAILLNQIVLAEVPASVRELTTEVTNNTQQCLGELTTAMQHKRPTAPGQAQAIQDLLDVLRWAQNQNLDTAPKPNWLKQDMQVSTADVEEGAKSGSKLRLLIYSIAMQQRYGHPIAHLTPKALKAHAQYFVWTEQRGKVKDVTFTPRGHRLKALSEQHLMIQTSRLSSQQPRETAPATSRPKDTQLITPV